MNDKKEKTIYGMLKSYKSRCRMHMPGHKGGKLVKRLLAKAASADITELPFSDNLQKPAGIIKNAEDFCARCYNAAKLKFSTCGSTTGILSLLHSIRHSGGSIIIERNSHTSVYSAIKISGLNPIIINNPLLENGLFGHIDAEEIEKALINEQDCIGALITSPDYFGNIADLEAISKVLKKYGKLLFTDASHGAHLPFFYGDIYKSADAYVCSAHKTLPALTPASFTAFNNISLYDKYLESFVIFHTSSPSYPVLASIEQAVRFMDKKGRKRLDDLKELGLKYKEKISSLGYDVIVNGDFTRFTISRKGCTGYDLYNYLAEKGLYCELADFTNILALFTVADNENSYKKLYKSLSSYPLCSVKTNNPAVRKPLPPTRAMSYIQAYNGEKELLPLSRAAGRVAASDAGIFPPSYPIVCCGDLITEEICRYLSENLRYAFGLDCGGIYVVK
jgi:lysine decarboxylase